MTQKVLRLGTRGSPLALWQAEAVRKLLVSDAQTRGETLAIDIMPIRTSGDWKPEATKDTTFRETGGNKELFTKEIDEALLAGAVDFGVHSTKDVGSWLPEGIVIAAMLERADPRDAFIGREAKTLDDLPQGATVGTSSLRRQAQILARRPDLKIVPFRGNVETRLRKLADGVVEATLLAVAGVTRLGLAHHISSCLPPEIMLPAAAQGAVGVTARRDDVAMLERLARINVQATFDCVCAERAFLRVLDGSCHTPIGALAVLREGALHLEGLAAKADGTLVVRQSAHGAAVDAEKIGESLGAQVRAMLPDDFCRI